LCIRSNWKGKHRVKNHKLLYRPELHNLSIATGSAEAIFFLFESATHFPVQIKNQRLMKCGWRNCCVTLFAPVTGTKVRKQRAPTALTARSKLSPTAAGAAPVVGPSRPRLAAPSRPQLE
jgi:hypothetical protein